MSLITNNWKTYNYEPYPTHKESMTSNVRDTIMCKQQQNYLYPKWALFRSNSTFKITGKKGQS